MTQRCRYCGLELRKNIALHENRCPRNPDVSPRLRDMMREYVEDGRAMPSAMYSEWVVGTGLPSLSVVRNVFGSYAAFCRWCGLEPPVSRWEALSRPKPEDMPGSIMANTEELWPMSVLRCVPARIPIREWHPHEKRYVDVGVQGVWRVR